MRQSQIYTELILAPNKQTSKDLQESVEKSTENHQLRFYHIVIAMLRGLNPIYEAYVLTLALEDP